MKTLLLFLSLIISTVGEGQDMPDLHILPEVDGVPTYVEVINIDSSLSQTELFNRAKIWFVDNYNSAKNVIQMEDKESGILIAKGAIPIKYNAQIESNNDSISREINLDIYHTIKIYLKKGKYKIIIADLQGKLMLKPTTDYVPPPFEFPLSNRNYKALPYLQALALNQTNSAILSTISSIKKAMKKSYNSSKDF